MKDGSCQTARCVCTVYTRKLEILSTQNQLMLSWGSFSYYEGFQYLTQNTSLCASCLIFQRSECDPISLPLCVFHRQLKTRDAFLLFFLRFIFYLPSSFLFFFQVNSQCIKVFTTAKLLRLDSNPSFLTSELYSLQKDFMSSFCIHH